MKLTKKFIPVGIITFLIAIYLVMQLSVPEIKATIISIHSSEGTFTQSHNDMVDSTIYYRMNWKSKYVKCQNESCITEVAIRHPIAIHLFFIGTMYYEYDLFVLDKENRKVYGCSQVPAWVKVLRHKGKWMIVDFYEKP